MPSRFVAEYFSGFLFTHSSLWMLVILILKSYSVCSVNSRSWNVNFPWMCWLLFCSVCFPWMCVELQGHMIVCSFFPLLFPIYSCMNVLFFPAVLCPRKVGGSGKPCGHLWAPVVEVPGLGLLGLLGVASGSFWALKPHLPLSWSKRRRRTEGLIPHLLPAASRTLTPQWTRPPPLLCFFPQSLQHNPLFTIVLSWHGFLKKIFCYCMNLWPQETRKLTSLVSSSHLWNRCITSLSRDRSYQQDWKNNCQGKYISAAFIVFISIFWK